MDQWCLNPSANPHGFSVIRKTHAPTLLQIPSYSPVLPTWIIRQSQPRHFRSLHHRMQHAACSPKILFDIKIMDIIWGTIS